MRLTSWLWVIVITCLGSYTTMMGFISLHSLGFAWYVKCLVALLIASISSRLIVIIWQHEKKIHEHVKQLQDPQDPK